MNPAREAELFDDGRVDDLLADEPEQQTAAEVAHDESRADAAEAKADPRPAPASAEGESQPMVWDSGRVRHDGKITVYLSNEELEVLGDTRLALRAEHGISVDRGRIVRAAVALAVEDMAVQGADSQLVTRLREL